MEPGIKPPLEGSSQWLRLDAGHKEQGQWLWLPSERKYPAESELLSALEDEGWEQVNAIDDTQIVMQLAGQFAPITYTYSPDSEYYQVWALKVDIERVRNMPVLLGFSNVAAGISDPLDEYGQPVLTLDIAELLPPPIYGNLGFVKVNTPEEGYLYYHIGLLGEAAQALQQQIAQALRELVKPGGWPVIHADLDAMIRLDGWKKGKKALTDAIKNATNPDDRTKIEAHLTRLNTDHAHVQAWQERMRKRVENYRQWQAQCERIQAIAISLAEMYWQYHQQQIQIQIQQEMLDKQSIIPVRVSDTGLMPIPSTKITSLTLEAMHQRPQRYIPKDGIPTWEKTLESRRKGFTGRFTAQFGLKRDERLYDPLIDEQETAASITTRKLYKRLEKKSDLHIDVFMILCAHAYITWGEDKLTYITIDQILEYRDKQGTRPRGDGIHTNQRAEDREQIVEVLEDLERWRVEYTIIDTKTNKAYSGDPYVLAISEWRKQRTLFMEIKPQVIGIYYLIGRAILVPDSQKPQVAQLLQTVLRYSPYHDWMEKRLGLWATMLFRMSNGADRKKSIAELHEEQGIEINQDDPKKSRERFEKALDRIVTDGIIKKWRYYSTISKKYYTPQELSDILPRKGWVVEWRALHIDITATADVQIEGTEREERHQRYIEADSQRIENARQRRPRKKKSE